VFRVYGSAVIDGEVTMVQVQLHLDPNRTGVDAVAAVGQFSALVRRPRDRTNVLCRPAHIAEPDSDGVHTTSSKRQCIVPMYARLGAVSEYMTINTTDERHLGSNWDLFEGRGGRGDEHSCVRPERRAF
jgi:hypothetical protein